MGIWSGVDGGGVGGEVRSRRRREVRRHGEEAEGGGLGEGVGVGSDRMDPR